MQVKQMVMELCSTQQARWNTKDNLGITYFMAMEICIMKWDLWSIEEVLWMASSLETGLNIIIQDQKFMKDSLLTTDGTGTGNGTLLWVPRNTMVGLLRVNLPRRLETWLSR